MKLFSVFPAMVIAVLVMTAATSCEIMPRNTLKDCRQQCKGRSNSKACYQFCDCIHVQGNSLDSCLERYEREGS